MTPPIVLSGVHREFSDVLAVNDVTLEVETHQWISIVGRSGSGKSTLLNLIGLLDRPTRGSVELFGLATDQLSPTETSSLRATKLGFVFQQSHLIPGRTVFENLWLGLGHAGVPRAQREPMIAATLTDVGLSHRRDAMTETLSGGERQRAAFARAVAHHPTVLLCDEPTGNLDTTTASVIARLIARRRDEGSSVVVVTHDPALASQGDKVLAISDGRLDGR